MQSRRDAGSDVVGGELRIREVLATEALAEPLEEGIGQAGDDEVTVVAWNAWYAPDPVPVAELRIVVAVLR